MNSIRIKNIRSIKDSDTIELRPITVAIGKNSCGKSTFIRTLPLLKQTIEKDVAESLLWYGDYVDFGNYSTIKPYFHSEENPCIELTTKTFLSTNYFSSSQEVDVHLKMVLSEKYIKQFSIHYYDQEVIVSLKENQKIESIVINGQHMRLSTNDYIWLRNSKELIPVIAPQKNIERAFWFFAPRFEEGVDNIVTQFRNICSSKAKEDTIKSFANQLVCFTSKSNLREKLISTQKFPTVAKFFKNCDTKDLCFLSINNNMVLALLPSLIGFINGTLKEEGNSMHYLKPIRANANRYYRIQGISTKELDSDGSNLPMILYNMDATQRFEFEQWTQEKFGIEFSVSTDSGHISLVAKSNGVSINLADTGYGYSQILPVILQLFLLTKNNIQNNRGSSFIFIIEQPELHLHPAFQAKIIDAFAGIVSTAKESGIDIKIIFETHSETMVNRLGYLIYKNRLQKELVNVLIFDKEDGITNVKSRSFNEKGLIDGWPTGFFSVED
ncbi:MAG: AAA family ATPase [Clostridia bacterium]|nr:AAA family ATPase [Clostridia bacterium]